MRVAAKANLASTLTRLARLDQSDRLGLMLLFSVSLHLLILLGVTFKAPEMKKSGSANALEVVLVNSKSASRPVKADALAQANLDGGGNTDADRRAKSPLPVLDRPRQASEVARKQQQVSQLEQQARTLMTQVKSAQRVEQAPAKPVEMSSADLVMKSLESARLEAQIARDWDAYQKKPKRKFLGARTQEYRFARYAEDWRHKVEKVGNLNYPEEAKREKIYGSLQLTVIIKADGSIRSIEVTRPSGQKVLDEAAVRIVRLAAPYAPFPEDIRKDIDELGIVRTWSFTRADQLEASLAD
ncbi:MAG: energy transducer TonB [Sulfuricella sp.]|nr:energy transducer TonB [Gammaproteobacteria bacterium]